MIPDSANSLDLVADIARIEMDRWGLKDWSFEWRRGKRRLGTCHHSKKAISLSRVFAQFNTIEIVLNTIRHEIAHAITPGHGHNSVWKAACKRVGCRPERLAFNVVVPRKWRVKCNGGCHVWYFHRLAKHIKTGQAACPICHSSLTIESGNFIRRPE